MKAIVMGERGMLGSDIVSYFRSRGATVLAFSSSQCDVTNRDCLADVLLSHTDSDIVINCAAYTAVDDCEKERERAFLVNGQAPGFLAQVCDRIAVPLVHFSTDYVFDGNKRGYYDESDATAPLSVYGASKLQGEQSVQSMLQSHYIFRVQWLYGVNGNHFLKTISRLAAERSELTIVNDQWGSPTWTYDIARYLYAFLSAKPAYGLYHFSNLGETTWYDVTVRLLGYLKTECQVRPISTQAFPRPARRPLNGKLSKQKCLSLGLGRIRTWESAMDDYFTKLEK